MSRVGRVEVRILVAAAAIALALGALVVPHAAVARATNAPTQVTDPDTTDTTPTTTPTTLPPTTLPPTTLPPTTAAPTTAPPTTRPHTTTTVRPSSTTTAVTTTTTLATTSTSLPTSSSVSAPALSNPASTTTTTKSKASSSGGLSDSAKLSIVVIGLLGVGGAILVLTYLYWRRTRPVVVTAVSPSALESLAGLDVSGPPTAPVPVVPADGAAAIPTAAVATDPIVAPDPDPGLHSLVPPVVPPTPPVVAGDGAGLGGVTPDPQAGVRILGPAVGLSAALASAAAERGDAGDGTGGRPVVGESEPSPVAPDAVPVLAPTPEEEAEQIARVLWPSRDEPKVAADGDGLDELWRTPLKIVTLEDLQQGGSVTPASADPASAAPYQAPPPDVIDLGDDRG